MRWMYMSQGKDRMLYYRQVAKRTKVIFVLVGDRLKYISP